MDCTGGDKFRDRKIPELSGFKKINHRAKEAS